MLFQSFGKVESIWPSSITGYVGLAAAMTSITIITYDRITGRASNWRDVKRDIKDLCDRLEREEAATKAVGSKLTDIDQLLTGINHELRGVGGDNGIRSAVRTIQTDISEIKKRNQRMDIKAAAFEQILRHPDYNGPERRNVVRHIQSLFGDEQDA
jgi:hypothetical protein